MKKIYMILVFTLFACKSGEGTSAIPQGEPLLQYSKGPCLGRCPVYDFMVYPDGNFTYKNVRAIGPNKEIKGRLATEEMEKLTSALKSELGTPSAFKRVRDLPITKLKFDTKKYEYHASKISEGLKKVNTLIEDMVAGIVVGQ
ncbi:DUF6438 domain-containing protein [Flagellimonas sp.]|uniref:DUF6438 domain-containing protein n=1 Tax=Flagellimonas sp. TaxID=2058762 RepID=UPI003B593A58